MPDRLSQLSPSTVDTVGNTPIVQLRKVVPKNGADVLIKLEYFNPTVSYKDRMALAMIEERGIRLKLLHQMPLPKKNWTQCVHLARSLKLSPARMGK